MSHVITCTEEIEEHGYCQQRPELKTGDKYLHEEAGKKRLHIVKSVHFDKYVWENVAQWTTVIEEYCEEEYMLCTIPVNIQKSNQSEIPVFVAKGLIGVLSCNKDLVCGKVIIPSKIGDVNVRGVGSFGFYDCQNLKEVAFSPMVMIAYEYAFAKSGIAAMAFNDEVPVMVHFTAIYGCKSLPEFDRIFDKPFPGKYLIREDEAFHEWEEKLYQLNLLNR